MYVISKCCRELDKNVIDDIDDISNVPRKEKRENTIRKSTIVVLDWKTKRGGARERGN